MGFNVKVGIPGSDADQLLRKVRGGNIGAQYLTEIAQELIFAVCIQPLAPRSTASCAIAARCSTLRWTMQVLLNHCAPLARAAHASHS